MKPLCGRTIKGVISLVTMVSVIGFVVFIVLLSLPILTGFDEVRLLKIAEIYVGIVLFLCIAIVLIRRSLVGRFWNVLNIESEERSSQQIFQFKQLERRSLEKKRNQGFNEIRIRDLHDTGAMLHQLSYKATHWELGQFIEFIAFLCCEVMWRIYEIIHICSAVLDDHRS